MYKMIRDILELAMKTEIIEAAIYRTWAEVCDKSDVAALLTHLAQAEDQHYADLLKKYMLYSSEKIFTYAVQPSDLEPTSQISGADCLAVLDYGIRGENAAAERYRQASERVSESVLKAFFQYLEKMEQEHEKSLRRLREKYGGAAQGA
ncbi:MAG: ferritin family protein [Candidatus Sumerlaeota bacterium]|nr:ferritin family protein [Candidatus Sumerlaeota bacterium]